MKKLLLFSIILLISINQLHAAAASTSSSSSSASSASSSKSTARTGSAIAWANFYSSDKEYKEAMAARASNNPEHLYCITFNAQREEDGLLLARHYQLGFLPNAIFTPNNTTTVNNITTCQGSSKLSKEELTRIAKEHNLDDNLRVELYRLTPSTDPKLPEKLRGIVYSPELVTEKD